MDPHAYAVAVVVGSALVGLWLAVRLQRFAPTNARSAGLCFVVVWLCPALAGPLLVAALLHLPVGLAVLVTVFPVFAVTFGLAGLLLRYLVGLIGHAAR
jgi:hypothetical protein